VDSKLQRSVKVKVNFTALMLIGSSHMKRIFVAEYCCQVAPTKKVA